MPAITVPRLGWSMEEGTFVEWLKADGERVSVGDALFVLESDKSTETVEAIDSGVLRITAGPKAGETVKLGQVIGHLLAVGQAFQPDSSDARRLPVPDVTPKSQAGKPDLPRSQTGKADLRPERVDHPAASPRARRVAR